ncbi:MAG: PAS domain S-box protein [Flectobacillus sp.]|uniref:PAS domain S-box protein n=1 Tax=Flectobacillus sp. TaxID=50419 RepID=UPI003B9B1B4F
MITIKPQKLRILVVEDNLGDYVLFEEYLHDTGLDVKEVQNVISVAEAKQALATTDYDLVFLDLSLPDSIGIQSIIDLNKMAAHIPIVVLSGMEDTQTTTEAIINGAQDYLIKGELESKLLSKTIRYSIERKRNLERIKQSNERYTMVSNATIGVVWDVNLVNREVVRSGDTFLHTHGYDELSFTSDFSFWAKRVHPEDIKDLENVIKLHLESKSIKFWEYEYRFQNGDGKYFYVHDRGSVIYDDNGAPVRMLGTMMDITERKESQEKLRISEYNYRQIFDNNPNPMWIYDSSTTEFLEVNPAAIAHYGYEYEEFLEMCMEDICPNAMQHESISLKNNQLQVHLKAGYEKIIVEVTAYPIDFAGRKAMQMLIRDVTEKVRAEEEKRILVQSLELFRNAPSLTKGLKACIETIRTYLGWEHSEIWMTDYQKEYIRLQTYSYTQEFEHLYEMVSPFLNKDIHINHTIYNESHHRSMPIWLNDLHELKGFQRIALSDKIGIHTAVSVPIIYDEKHIGWMVFFSKANHQADESIIAFLAEVAKQLGAEIEKRNADEMLKHFFLLSNDLLGIVTLEGFFVRINNAFLHVLGYNTNEINEHAVLDFVHPDDKQKTLEILTGIQDKSSVSFLENRFIAKDKTIRWISWSVTYLPDEKLIFASGRDVTQQKEEELQLRLRESVITNSNDAIVITEPDLENACHKAIYYNEAFLRLSGYDPAEIIANPTSMLVGEKTDLGAIQKISYAIAHWMHEQVEIIVYRKNGEQFWASLEVVPVPDAKGEFTHAISVFRDISARKKAEAEREVLIRELTDSNTDLKQFTFITSHNLRAPLSNLMGILELVDPDVIQDAETLELLNKFKESTVLLNQTINDLLDVLVIKNQVNLEKKSLDLNIEFEKVKNSVGYQVRETGAVLKTDFSLAEKVSFDSSYLESILLNLLTNALKYRSLSRPLEIQVFTKDTPNYTELYFCDNGIGIDLNRHQSKIFGLYQRFHDYPDSKGLGLYIVSSQIRALGGKIDVKSEVDKGTTFIVYFAKN